MGVTLGKFFYNVVIFIVQFNACIFIVQPFCYFRAKVDGPQAQKSGQRPPGLIASTTYKGKGKGVLYPRRNVGGVLISVT